MSTASLTAFITATSRPAYIKAVCTTILAAALMLYAALSINVWVISEMSHDTFILLDGAWRVAQGQRPHTDFYSPLGCYPLYLAAAGLTGAPSMRCLVLAESALCVVVMAITLYIACRRLPALLSSLLAIHLGLLVLAPRSLGLPLPLTSFAMLYNRQGEALLALLLIMWLVPTREPLQGLPAWNEGFLSGLFLVLLAFVKVNYFSVACGGIVLALLLARPATVTWLGALTGGAIALAAFHFCAGISFPHMIADTVLALQAQETGQRRHLLLELVRFNLPILLLVILGLLWPFLTDARIDRRQRGRTALVFAFFALAGFALCASNMQNKDIVLLGLAPLVLLQPTAQWLASQETDAPARARFLFRFILALIVPGSIAVQDAVSLGYCWTWDRVHASELSAEQRFHSAMLADMVVPDDDAYTAFVNDGIHLLERNEIADARLLVFEFANPFSFALRLPSPRGDALWWHAGKTFSSRAHSPPAQVLREVDVALTPLTPREVATVQLLEEVYGPYLRAHFTQVATSRHWILWKRR